MSSGRDGGGLKGLMMLAMVFVFGGAAYLAARDYETDQCEPFYDNINVERRVGEVRKCGVALGPSLSARQVLLQVKGGAGTGIISMHWEGRLLRRAWIQTPEQDEPELILGADPLVPTSYIKTK